MLIAGLVLGLLLDLTDSSSLPRFPPEVGCFAPTAGFSVTIDFFATAGFRATAGFGVTVGLVEGFLDFSRLVLVLSTPFTLDVGAREPVTHF